MIARITIGGGFLALMLMTVAAGICIAEETPGFEQTNETNYCHDPAAEVEWMGLLAKNPTDLDVQALYALRIGLCVKKDQGMLSVGEATKIFERARRALIGGEDKRAGAGDAGVLSPGKRIWWMGRSW